MSNKKKQNKIIREKYNLEQEKKQNPGWCYCDDPVIDETQPIGQTKPIDGFPHPHSKGYTQDIYMCQTCGKKHTILIAFA